LKLLYTTLYMLIIFTSLTQNLYARKTENPFRTGLKQSNIPYTKNNQVYGNILNNPQKNNKFAFGLSAHLFYPKASLENLFETSFGFGASASYRIYPKWEAGTYISYTPLILFSKYNETPKLESAHIFNSSLLLKYQLTQEILLNFKFGYIYYSTKYESTSSEDIHNTYTTGKWCPAVSLGPSIIFSWIKNINFMIDLSYDAFYLDQSYKYYFLTNLTIVLLK